MSAKILLVEDDIFLRDGIKEALKKEGYSVFTAEDCKTAKSEFEPLSTNSIEILSLLNDEISKKEALETLQSNDEFEQYDAIKFLVNYGAKDALPEILKVMKTSSLSERYLQASSSAAPLESVTKMSYFSLIPIFSIIFFNFSVISFLPAAGLRINKCFFINNSLYNFRCFAHIGKFIYRRRKSNYVFYIF